MLPTPATTACAIALCTLAAKSIPATPPAPPQTQQATSLEDTLLDQAAPLVQRVLEARAKGDADLAIRLERQARAPFEEALAAQPKNIALRLKYHQLLRNIIDPYHPASADNTSGEFAKRMREVLEEARQIVDPADPAFTDVYLAYSTYLRLYNNDPAGAEALLREALKRKPGEHRAQFNLANLIHNESAEKRDEAVALMR